MENREPLPGGDPEADAGRAGVKGAQVPAMRAVLRVAAYPFLLAGAVSVAATALCLDWDPDRVSPLFLLGVIFYFTVLERLIPHRRSWHPNSGEWCWYGVYFVLTMVSSAFAQYLVSVVVSEVSPSESDLNLWAEIPAALLTGSLASYLVHRLGHTNAILWRLHGVHHVPEKVNVANNGVNHVLDIVLAQGTVQLALALVGFSRDSVFVVGLFVAAQGYFIHANIDVRIGRLNHVLAGPEQHRLHHSTDLSEAGHYGSDLSIWDHAFGSYTWHPGREPVAVGLGDPAAFPRTGEIVASLLHPLRRAKGPGTGSV
ncbi:sterol desaturase family protein [Streptomyces sp. NPDC057575]|uniref:sterol desaturase family protein n=1 Tax=unclassified Streptomyces TaxID=2593676 RepID=UPI00369A3E48